MKQFGPMTKKQAAREVREAAAVSKAVTMKEIRSVVRNEVMASQKTKTRRSNNPRRQTEGKTSQRTHCEKFSEQVPTTINGSATAASVLISINPGDDTVFSRLVQLANLYQEYRFKSLNVKYIPNGSAFAANNQTGELVLAVTDNFHSPRAWNVSVARARTPSVAGNAWEPLTLTVPGSILNRWRFLRSNQSSFGAEPNLYDFLLEIFTYQTPNSNGIGYIELSGEVEMRTDYVGNLVNPVVTNRAYAFYQGTSQTITANTLTPLSTASTNDMNNSLISGFAGRGANAITLTGGTYFVTMRASITGTTITSAYLVDTVNGASYINNTSGATPDIGGSTFSAAGIELTDSFIIVIPEDGASTVQFSVNLAGTGTLAVTNWALSVIAL